jgi:ribonuclease-3
VGILEVAVDAPDQPLLRPDSLTHDGAGSGLPDLEQALGHRFRDPGLLRQAITHAGSHHGRGGGIDNERLEFLGDRVLGLVVAELLVERFPAAPEGELTPRLHALVRAEALAEIAETIGLGRHLVLAPADAAAGVRPRMLSDAMEAVIAALYLDGGLDAARSFIRDAWQRLSGAIAAPPLEPKTALQEWAQGKGRPLPVYAVVREAGKAHDPVFEVMVTVHGLAPESGMGPSKRAAEKAAALAALRRLGLAPREAE